MVAHINVVCSRFLRAKRKPGRLSVVGLDVSWSSAGAARPSGLPPIYKVLVMSHLPPSHSLGADAYEIDLLYKMVERARCQFIGSATQHCVPRAADAQAQFGLERMARSRRRVAHCDRLRTLLRPA